VIFGACHQQNILGERSRGNLAFSA
jgi:hypothetical protein